MRLTGQQEEQSMTSQIKSPVVHVGHSLQQQHWRVLTSWQQGTCTSLHSNSWLIATPTTVVVMVVAGILRCPIGGMVRAPGVPTLTLQRVAAANPRLARKMSLQEQ